MAKLKWFIFFGFLCSSYLSGFADAGLYFRHLTRSEGLLHDNVTCITQDSIGYIWFGTHRGLNRFDGYLIDSYRYDNGKNNSVYYNRVYTIEIADNFLWMATEAGVACFDIRKKQYVDVVAEDSVNQVFYSQVRALKISRDGLLWFFTDLNHIRLGKAYYDPVRNRCIISARKIGDDYDFVSQDNSPKLAYDESGNVWIAGKDRLSCYSPGSDGELYFAGYSEQASGRDVKEMRYENGYLWIASWDKLVKYNVLSVTKIEPVQTILYSRRNVSSLYLSNDFIWLGSDYGVLQIGKKINPATMVEHMHSSSDANSIGNDPNNIFLDRNNTIWVSTWGAGVSYANTVPKLFQTIDFKLFVSSIHSSSDGCVYLGTKFGGISRFKSKNEKEAELFCRASQMLPSITSIQSDAENIFAAVNNTIVVIGKQSKRIIEILPTARYVFGIEFDRFNRLWAATYAGLECFEKQKNKWIKKQTLTIASQSGLSTDLLHNIYSDKGKNELMVTSARGVNRILFKENGDIKNIVCYKAKETGINSLSSDYLWPIDKQNDSVYWIGSMGNGLNRLTLIDRPDGTYDYACEVYGREEGAPSDDIESVEVDKYGNVWCGGYSLSCFDSKLKRFNVFDINDGLQSYMFGTSSSCKDSNGTLYFGGAKGMNYFMPAPNMPDATVYPVFFSRIYINGKLVNSDIEFSKALTLKYPDNNFTLDFTSLSFNTGQHIRYRYRLDGYDNEWRTIEMGNEPKVSYRKLSYGNYKLMVESGGWKDWKGDLSIMTLRVLPPVWWSRWAKSIYLLITICLIYFLLKSFMRWMQMKQTLALQIEREQQKEEMMQLKMRFFTDVSHEFKTPLSIINSSIAELDEEEIAIRENKHFGLIKRNSNKLLKLINELLDFHRADIREAHLKTTFISAQQFIAQIYDEFQTWANSSGISMTISMPEKEIRLWLDEEHFGKIISNILSNSIRYTEAGGNINVEVSTGNAREKSTYYEASLKCLDDLFQNNHLLITVRDTGVGISAESLPKIFERFHQVDSKISKHLGSGIGLALVRSLICLHHGGIIVSSKRDVGTEISIALPLDDSYLNKDEKVDESSFEIGAYLSDYAVEYEQLEWNNQPKETPDDKPTLLLVDDNQEILMILREHFKQDYNTILAFDGEEALRKCNAEFPDVVISDVMMPKMTGIELCITLKKSLRTCFIPIILLSAKSLVENQIEGVESGADAYIPKPFDIRLVRATVRNLLSRSGQLKNFNAAQFTINKRKQLFEEKQQNFLVQLTNLVETNMNNPNFSVDHLCLELGINRSKLYSAVKEVSGMTLGHYILKIRLDKAARLLKNRDMTITETCYQIGIESPSYFSKVFKFQFGMSPSEFIKT